MRNLPNRYKVWSKILQKHENAYEEAETFNLNALYSNQKQADNELRKGRMTQEEWQDLTDRYQALKKKIEEKISG